MRRADQRGMVGPDRQGFSGLHGGERQHSRQYQPEMRESHLLKSALSLLDEMENAKRQD